jgi:hypothetical protein
MTSEKTFTYAGVSTNKDGQVKVRFGCNLMRVKVMAKFGDTNIDYIEMPSAMTKAEISKYLQTIEMYQNPVNKEAIDESVEKYNSVAKVKNAILKTAKPSTKKTPSTKKDVASNPADTLASLKKRASEKASAE